MDDGFFRTMTISDHTCKKELDLAAAMVQNAAYSLADQLDNTMLTEMIVASRKLERISKRISSVGLAEVPLQSIVKN
jgi:hypothetical protein